MPKCIVNGCSHNTKKKQIFPNVVLHVFPGNIDIIKNWLNAMPQDFGDINVMAQKVLDGKKSDAFRVCSEHFTGDSYTYQGSKRVLKKDAVPSIFPQSSQPSGSTGSVEQSTLRARKRQKITPHGDIHDITPLSSPSTTSVDLSELGASTSVQSTSSTTMEKNLSSEPSTSGVTQLPPFSQDITMVAEQSISVHEAATSRYPKKSKQKNPLLVDTGSHPIYFANTKSIGINTNPKHFSKNRALQTHIPQKHKSIQCEIVNTSQRDSLTLDFESGLPNIPQSTPIKIPPPEHGLATLFKSTAFDQGHSSESQNPYNYQPLEETLETTAESIELSGADRLDESYKPSMESLLLMEKEQEETIKDSTIDSNVFHQSKNPDFITENKFMVFESCLDTLLMSSRCKGGINCPHPIKNIKKKIIGSFLSVFAECYDGHKFHLWDSQPKKNRMPVGNIMMSAAILLSGSNYSKVSHMNKILGLKHVGKTTHYRNQRTYLFPTVNHHWQMEQKETLKEIGDKPVCLSGDGQCDSPGFCAKYCVYTFLESTTKKIVHFNVDQVSPASSSVALEKKTFKKTLTELLKKKVNVRLVCTDRHSAVRKAMREKFKKILHQFDIWHFAKSIGNKIGVASKKKSCRELAQWITPIKNHLWWAARTCDGNVDVLLEKWCSVLYHVTGVHRWKVGRLYHECEHEEIEDEADKRRLWLKKGSIAHLKLCEIVENRTVIKDIKQLSEFCHTGELELYHSNVLKYRSKRHHYFMDGMIARTQLAAIDHNRNVHREQARLQVNAMSSGSEGDLRHRMEYSKIKKDWVIKPVYQLKNFDFAFDIMRDVLSYLAGEKCFEWESANSKLPRNIAPIPRPSKKELVEKHTSRFAQ